MECPRRPPVQQHERTLCELRLGDAAFIDAALAGDGATKAASELDAKAHALVRLGALIALNASSPSYMSAIERARRAGASEDEIVGTLIAVMPAVGAATVVAAAPELGLGMGYDVAAALEGGGVAPSA